MICERFERVQERIANAARRAGRQAGEIRLLAVTKTHPRPVVEEAIACGLTVLGENRVQEADAKYAGVEGAELHLIGHLQRNKARAVPGLFSWVETVDSLALAEALARRCADAEWKCSVLLQYNCSGEETKSGYSDSELMLEEAARIAALPSLELRGLMTIGPFVDDTEAIARDFSTTRKLFERLRAQHPEGKIDTLSMGMTGDFEIAIVEGSTEVRIGSALFGARG